MPTQKEKPRSRDAAGRGERGGYGRQDGDDEVQNLAPKFFLVHGWGVVLGLVYFREKGGGSVPLGG